jgi:osmotically-inducible protein OsmY
MRNLGKLILVSSATAALALTTFTGCESYRAHTYADRGDRSEGRMVDDRRITADIKTGLRTEPTYKFNDVDVKTFNGVVQLSGFVNSGDQKTRAGEIAQRAEGVSQVQNNILLKPQSTTPTGRVDANVNVNTAPARR